MIPPRAMLITHKKCERSVPAAPAEGRREERNSSPAQPLSGVAVSNCLAHVLLDFEASKYIPDSASLQRSRELKKLRVIQVGHHPVRRFSAVPVEDLVALRFFLLNGVVGGAAIRP